VPVRASVVVEGWALLVNVSVELAAPVVVGLNVTENDTLLPAAIVTGSDRPPTLNTELSVLAPVTVTLAPLAVRVPEAGALFPITTLPISSVAGLAVSWPAVAAPVPDNGIVRVGFDAVEVIVTLPLALPAVVGANVTVNVAPCPEPSVTGVEIPLIEN